VAGLSAGRRRQARSWNRSFVGVLFDVTSSADFGEEVVKLGNLFKQNFAKYADQATEEVINAGPTV
jgi:hypothetical protein